MHTRETREGRTGVGRGGLAELRRELGTLPNLLTASRLVLLPVLWGLALLGEAVWLGIGVMAASITDMLDGYLSRRWNQTSEFGARLDSVADHLLAVSTTLWLVLLRPFFFREQKWALILWAAFALLVLLVSWLKFRRFVNLHLYTSKAAVILAFLFGVPLLVLGRYHPVHFWITLAACTLAAAESLAVILTRDRVDENIGSILVRRRS
jgi:phosphatidylglycerophosphate synthase